MYPPSPIRTGDKPIYSRLLYQAELRAGVKDGSHNPGIRVTIQTICAEPCVAQSGAIVSHTRVVYVTIA